MELILFYNGLVQTIQVDDSMTITEIFLTACLTFMDTDEPSDKSLALYFKNQKLNPEKSLKELFIPDKSELYLSNRPPQTTSKPASSNSPGIPTKKSKADASSKPKKDRKHVLSTAIESLATKVGTPSSSSTDTAAIPTFDFSSITVDKSKTKSSQTTDKDLDNLQLDQAEINSYKQMFNFYKMPGADYMRADLMQTQPDLHEALKNNNLNDFLEIHRKNKIAQKKREKEVFNVIANPNSEESKKYLTKLNKTEAVYENFQKAMEHTPEVFGNVFMLYINCKVNGVPTKAFVDSGAQKTIISSKWCEKCDLEGILDERFSGMAKGVGFQKIKGRVHYAMMEIEGKFFSTSFDVLEGQDIDILIGLDFLKRHRANINLGSNELHLPNENLRTKFLGESELPNSSVTKQNEQAEASSSSGNSLENSEIFKENLKKMVEMGFDEGVCKEILIQAGGEYSLAVQNLLGTQNDMMN